MRNLMTSPKQLLLNENNQKKLKNSLRVLGTTIETDNNNRKPY